MVTETEETRKIFQEYFAQLFGRDGGPERKRDFTDFLDGLPRLSGREVECCEIPITAAEVKEALSDCGGYKSQGLDGRHYELYYRMPDLFGYLLACDCTN